MVTSLESLARRISPALFLILAVGGALLVAVPAAADSLCKPAAPLPQSDEITVSGYVRAVRSGL